MGHQLDSRLLPLVESQSYNIAEKCIHFTLHSYNCIIETFERMFGNQYICMLPIRTLDFIYTYMKDSISIYYTIYFKYIKLKVIFHLTCNTWTSTYLQYQHISVHHNIPPHEKDIISIPCAIRSFFHHFFSSCVFINHTYYIVLWPELDVVIYYFVNFTNLCLAIEKRQIIPLFRCIHLVMVDTIMEIINK